MATLAGEELSLVNQTGKNPQEHTNPLFKSLRMLKVPNLIEYQSLCFIYNYMNKKCPSSFTDFFRENRSKNIILEVPTKQSLAHFPTYCLPKIWNNSNISYKRLLESLHLFKANFKELFPSKYYLLIPCAYLPHLTNTFM